MIWNIKTLTNMKINDKMRRKGRKAFINHHQPSWEEVLHCTEAVEIKTIIHNHERLWLRCIFFVDDAKTQHKSIMEVRVLICVLMIQHNEYNNNKFNTTALHWMKQNKTKETLVGWLATSSFLAKIRREKEKQVFGVRLPLFCGTTCTLYPHVYNFFFILL